MSWKGWGKPWRASNSSDGYVEQYSGYASSGHGKGKQGRTEEWPHHSKKDGKVNFPSYNAQPKQDIAVVAEKRMAPAESHPEEDVIKATQRAVNSARKAEQRVNKLQGDLAKGQSQWQAYEVAIRKAYMSEKAKFQKDQAKLRTELSEALSQQSLTRNALRTAAIGHVRDAGQEMIVDGDQEEDDFLALMKDTTIVEDVEQKRELDGWLQEELGRLGSPGTAAAAKARIVAAMKGGDSVATPAMQTTPNRPTQGGMATPSKTLLAKKTGAVTKAPTVLQPFGGPAGQAVRGNMEPLQSAKATQYRQETPAVSDPYLTSPSAAVLPEVGGPWLTPL